MKRMAKNENGNGLYPENVHIDINIIQWTLVITTLLVTKDLAVKSNL